MYNAGRVNTRSLRPHLPLLECALTYLRVVIQVHTLLQREVPTVLGYAHRFRHVQIQSIRKLISQRILIASVNQFSFALVIHMKRKRQRRLRIVTVLTVPLQRI